MCARLRAGAVGPNSRNPASTPSVPPPFPLSLFHSILLSLFLLLLVPSLFLSLALLLSFSLSLSRVHTCVLRCQGLRKDEFTQSSCDSLRSTALPSFSFLCSLFQCSPSLLLPLALSPSLSSLPSTHARSGAAGRSQSIQPRFAPFHRPFARLLLPRPLSLSPSVLTFVLPLVLRRSNPAQSRTYHAALGCDDLRVGDPGASPCARCSTTRFRRTRTKVASFDAGAHDEANGARGGALRLTPAPPAATHVRRGFGC